MSRAVRFALVALAVVFAWSEVTQSWREWGTFGLYFTFLAFVPLQLASATSLLLAARRTALPPALRRSLRLLAGSFVMFALGSATLAYIAIRLDAQPRYSVADLFYALAYPLQIAGFLMMPKTPDLGTRRSRRLLDIGALLLVSAILVLAHRELRSDWSGLEQLMATTFPVLAMAGLVAANLALVRGQRIPSRRAWGTLIYALTASLLTDVIFQTLWASGYDGINWSLPIGVAVNIAVIWAGEWYATDPVATGPPDPRALIPFSPLPLLVAACGSLVLLILAMQSNLSVLRIVLVALILLNIVMAVRDSLLVLDATGMVRRATAEEGERRFEALVRHSTDLILVADAGRRVRFASAPVLRLLGRPPETVTGQPLAALLHPEDQPGVAAVLDELLQAPGGTATTAARFLHTSGEWRRFECSVANLTTEPAVEGLVLNCRDVTERTQLEEQLRQAQKMEVVGQLAGGVAHDFNNLLTTVLASSEFALQDLPAEHQLRQDIENIKAAAVRGAALTSRLLAFSRPRGVDPRVVGIADLLRATLPLMQRLVGEGCRLGLELETEAAARLDAVELEHALLNLVANARDAQRGQGSITLTVRDAHLERPLDSPFLSAPPGRYVMVEVADTGPGLDQEARSRLFQPFYTTKGPGKGTGLGLVGVLAFVRRTGGGVTVESAPGEGARFRLWLPTASAEAPPPVREPTTQPAAGQGTILLVEDDDVVRRSARRILASSGYRVVEAGSAAEARTALGTLPGPPDLLLTDVMMPGETGASLVEGLRQRYPGLPVLYVSGYPGEDLAQLGLVTGAVELLRKPFSSRELLARVAEVIASGRPSTHTEPS